MLSLKLATSNLRKGFKQFAPFLMACVTMFVLMFVTSSIGLSKSIDKLPGGSAVSQLMTFALVVLAIFGTFILIYSYRFLQLQRSKEFGLYDILGFGKKRIVAVAFLELLMSYLLTVIVGAIVGIAFAKFLFLIYVNLIGGNYFNLIINPLAIVIVAVIFLMIFILLLLIGLVIIWRSSSLDLLKEASKGEKEPKSNIFLALLGVIFLAVGYFLASSVDNPVKALTNFFIAVLAVIIGTYFFYISFTVWYLKWRKKRKSYYKPQNFITISSMLYRMKANAAGLANITILLSMSIVTIVVTLGLFVGTAQSVSQLYPRGAQISFVNNSNSIDNESTTKEKTVKATQPTTMSRDMLESLTKNIATRAGVSLSNLSTLIISNDVSVERQKSSDNQMIISGAYGSLVDKNSYYMTLTTLDSLKSLGMNHLPTLSENEVMMQSSAANTGEVQRLSWYGTDFKVTKHLPVVPNFPYATNLSSTALIVFANEKALNAALETYNKAVNSGQNQTFVSLTFTAAYFDLPQNEQDKFKKAFQSMSTNDKLSNQDAQLSFRSDAFQQQRSQIGGFVFIGFVLGISFILGAALIIYYKQLSEGTQDKRSFKILQEVGLSKIEVQKTIKSQVRMIFFLPLVITVIHFAFAYRMIAKIIEIFGINNQLLVAEISGLTILGIGIMYWIIYKITSRVYYKIVER